MSLDDIVSIDDAELEEFYIGESHDSVPAI